MPPAPDIANNVCCDAKMEPFSITYPTCSAYQTGTVSVARYPGIELNLGDVSRAPFRGSERPTHCCFCSVRHRTLCRDCENRERVFGRLPEDIRVRVTCRECQHELIWNTFYCVAV